MYDDDQIYVLDNGSQFWVASECSITQDPLVVIATESGIWEFAEKHVRQPMSMKKIELAWYDIGLNFMYIYINGTIY